MTRAFGLTEGEFAALITVLGSIAVAMIGGGFALVKIWLDQRSQRGEIAAIKTATTVNHHASDPPTLVDRLDTVQQTISGLTATVQAHHDEQQRRNDQQDARLAARVRPTSRSTNKVDL